MLLAVALWVGGEGKGRSLGTGDRDSITDGIQGRNMHITTHPSQCSGQCGSDYHTRRLIQCGIICKRVGKSVRLWSSAAKHEN